MLNREPFANRMPEMVNHIVDYGNAGFKLKKEDGWGMSDRFFHNTFTPFVTAFRRPIFLQL